jgi:hypothetical protein
VAKVISHGWYYQIRLLEKNGEFHKVGTVKIRFLI